MSEGRLTVRDGRTLAWREYGPNDGRPHLRFQGTPGSRYSRHPHENSYDRYRVPVILFDRPGYGASSRLPGRGISAVADDAAELLDHLGLDVVHVAGGSGGGPHALAFAARYPERVRAATVVVGGAPIEEADLSEMIALNREAWYAAHESWDAMHALLAPLRDEILLDPKDEVLLSQPRCVCDVESLGQHLQLGDGLPLQFSDIHKRENPGDYRPRRGVASSSDRWDGLRRAETAEVGRGSTTAKSEGERLGRGRSRRAKLPFARERVKSGT